MQGTPRQVAEAEGSYRIFSRAGAGQPALLCPGTGWTLLVIPSRNRQEADAQVLTTLFLDTLHILCIYLRIGRARLIPRSTAVRNRCYPLSEKEVPADTVNGGRKQCCAKDGHSPPQESYTYPTDTTESDRRKHRRLLKDARKDPAGTALLSRTSPLGFPTAARRSFLTDDH